MQKKRKRSVKSSETKRKEGQSKASFDLGDDDGRTRREGKKKGKGRGEESGMIGRSSFIEKC